MEILFFLGVGGVILGLFLIIKGYMIIDKSNRYEFDNRQQGGNVGFQSYDHAKGHESMKGLGKVMMIFGFISLLGGGFFALIGVFAFLP